MAKSKGTAGRYGTKFGRTLREKVSNIEKKSRGKYKCPYCSKQNKVKRVAYGIWQCRSCEKKFIGKAYTPK